MIQHTAIIDFNLDSDITVDFMFSKFDELDTAQNLVRAIKYVSNANVHIMYREKAEVLDGGIWESKAQPYYMILLKEDVMNMIATTIGKPMSKDEKLHLVRNLIRSIGHTAHGLNFV